MGQKQAAPLPFSFHAYQQFLTQSGGALVWTHHRKNDPSWDFRSERALEQAIYQRLATWNDNPKPFLWTATADIILEKVRRCKELNGTAW